MKNALQFSIVMLIIAFVICWHVKPFYNSNDARSALESQGFKEIQITGWSAFACGEDDFYSTGFTAKNSQGNTVDGTVCSGLLFKNSTIRW